LIEWTYFWSPCFFKKNRYAKLPAARISTATLNERDVIARYGKLVRKFGYEVRTSTTEQE
jgi:hypothetical protein